MKTDDFMNALCALNFENTFNPYSRKCDVYDLPDAPRRKSSALLAILEAAADLEVDAIWIGRDLGYRGGRRTGLALTDDVHVCAHAARWSVAAERPTKGEPVIERTAAVIWSVLSQIRAHVFLWNVFPLHPHEPGDPFSNRSHNALERQAGEEILAQLIILLKPKRLIAIGIDAAKATNRITASMKVHEIRHPSYGGQTQFLRQTKELYSLPEQEPRVLF